MIVNSVEDLTNDVWYTSTARHGEEQRGLSSASFVRGTAAQSCRPRGKAGRQCPGRSQTSGGQVDPDAPAAARGGVRGKVPRPQPTSKTSRSAVKSANRSSNAWSSGLPCNSSPIFAAYRSATA